MPRYDYRCPVCGAAHELELPMEHKRPECADCVEWIDGIRIAVLMEREYTRPPLVPPSRVQS